MFALTCTSATPAPPVLPAPIADGSLWVRVTAPPPSQERRYCAWFGDAREGILYFGESAFWWAFNAGGRDPRADLRVPGLQRIGRFDLQAQRLLPALDLGGGREASGVWDVLAHANGRVYFTSLFGQAGAVEVAGGAVTRFQDLGLGLVQLAPGPDDGIVASRSRGEAGREDEVVLFDEDGALLQTWTLTAPAGVRFEPKAVAYDASRHQIWVTTDRIDEEAGRFAAAGHRAEHHPTFVLDRHGPTRQRIDDVEIQALHFEADGTGWLALVRESQLTLTRVAPGPEPADLGRAWTRILDPRFPRAWDFVQDLQVTDDGRIVVTRWSGVIHVVDAAGEASVAALPELDPYGLYYTAVVTGDRLCATYCDDLSIVCGPAPRAPLPQTR